MTKADLVEKIFEKIGLSKKEAQEIIEILFDTMKQTFIEGESVKISGFGTFNVRQKMARRGRNPKTGDDLEITPRRVITFRASNQLKAFMEKMMSKSAQQSLKTSISFPDKLFYKIGEVSRIVDVEPYVLRYWETEFPFLKPRKNKSGQRVYVKKDVELLLTIKNLLYQERYTIEGVRKQLGVASAGNESRPAKDIQKREVSQPSAAIEHVKKRLREILSQLQ